MVTGTIGDAALGLDVLKAGAVATALAGDAVGRTALIRRYRVPQPRVALAAAIRDFASAAMDVSDGLAGDLAKLCAVSKRLGRHRYAGHSAVGRGGGIAGAGVVAIEAIVAGGDDYEVLCTISEASLEAFAAAAVRAGVPVSSIGTVIAGGRRAALSRRAGP